MSIRYRILVVVFLIGAASLLGAAFSFFQIFKVDQSVSAIDKSSLPLSRILAGIEFDSHRFRREAVKRLGYRYWRNDKWKPNTVPEWMYDSLKNQFLRAKDIIQSHPELLANDQLKLSEWIEKVIKDFEAIHTESKNLKALLQNKKETEAFKVYPAWVVQLNDWSRYLDWGIQQSEGILKSSFKTVQAGVLDLRTALQIVLASLFVLSIFVIWMSERLLQPLSEMRRLAKSIIKNQLTPEDKARLPQFPLKRNDEVSLLGRELNNMATALMEREKIVEDQKRRLEDNNKLLFEIGMLNEAILTSIESSLIVLDLAGNITHVNPAASRLISLPSSQIIENHFSNYEIINNIVQKAFGKDIVSRIQGGFEGMESTQKVRRGQKVFQVHLTPLEGDSKNKIGTVIVIDDVTNLIEIEDRLRQSENLAAVGRMSSQVAHEVRNPLHSIGLEAELLLEKESGELDSDSRQSVQSILQSVDRLEKITENYLKLSKISVGKRKVGNLGEIIESVFSLYSVVLSEKKIHLDWSIPSQEDLRIYVDVPILEQAIGNLLKNSIQSLEGRSKRRKIFCEIKIAANDLVVSIYDNGSGIPTEVEARLFQPFMTTKAQGTGLGLTFVKRVLEDQKGKIKYVRPSGREWSTCFEVTLPRYQGKSASIPRAPGRSLEV